ncbi:hypothetical protein PPL_12523 [Heterostelium album PN500]|uniref:Leucine-rich repeat-containing protein n=1 Tax=Heterostelium pallidum (strain ATCC 26659 / Pp 5 / PN500) TaxID=670386 RepID=D3BMV0_HETP5|nr:hypothetical protein PPL_12523 [Heterostelium album PN500]EFA77312.1 hypothetical protein PPL_12523 [Heterostelium album PN500]|eukprot:XP_020429441.1 hypothetical protein PPL_12523 [Heterostelium album PN500]
MNQSASFSLSIPNSPPVSTATTTTTTSTTSYSGASTPKSTTSQSPKCSLTPRGVTPRQYPPHHSNNTYGNNNHCYSPQLSQSSPLPLPPPPLLPTPSTPPTPFLYQSKSAIPINPLANSTNSIASAGYNVNGYENGLMTPSSSSSSISPSASPSSMSFYPLSSQSLLNTTSNTNNNSSSGPSRSKSQNSTSKKSSKLFSSLSFGHSSSAHHHHHHKEAPLYSPSKGSSSAPTTPSLLTPTTSRSQIPHPSTNNSSSSNNSSSDKLTKSISSSSSSSNSSGSNNSIKPYKVHKKIKYRLKMTELSGGEKRFVFDLEGRDPDFCLWVKKTNKKDVVQDRLFVLTQYNVYSIKRNKLGKKHVQRQGHLYDLVEIKTDDIDHVLLRFSTFTIDISGNNTGITIPKILINAFHRISFTFSLEASPSLIIIPVERQAPEIENIDPGFAHGFVEVYKAQCNYYNSPFVLDLVQFLEETVSQGNREFCLDDFAGIDKTAEGAINLIPVMASLRHNTYFDSFVCHNKTRKEVPQLLADVFHHNRTLTRVSLRGIDTDEGWVQLGDALRENTSNELRYLDISDNPVRDRGITSITNAIRAFSREFCQLSASNIDLQSKGAAVMFRSLQANYASSGAIEILDLSNNHLGTTGSDPLQDFFALMNSSNPNPEKPMRHLNLENTQIDTPRITNAIRQANVQNLQFLNLSENKFTNESVQGICLLISKGQNLTDIQLRGCGLLGEQVALLIQACTNGAAVEQRSLDLSNNNLGKNGALTFAPTIKNCTNITSLLLSLNNFRKRGMTYIISALEENTTLRSIDLSNNLKSGSKADSVIDHLARVVQRHPNLEKLVLAGRDSRGFFLGRELLPLVKSMNEESRLVELDINGNAMGDDLCRELFESLKKNSSLRTLNIDNNAIGLAGLAAMKRCFSVNRTLSDIPVPTRDIAKILGAAKDRKTTNDKIAEILNDVQWALANNKNGIPYTDIPSSTVKTTSVAVSSGSTPNFRATTYISNPSSPMINNNRSSADDIGRYSAGGAAPASTSHFTLSHSSPAPAQKLYNPPPPPPLYDPYQQQQQSYQPPPPPPPAVDNNYDQYSYDHQQQEQQEQPSATDYDQQYYNHDNTNTTSYDESNADHDQHQQYDQTQYDHSQYDQNQYDQSTEHHDQQQQYNHNDTAYEYEAQY